MLKKHISVCGAVIHPRTLEKGDTPGHQGNFSIATARVLKTPSCVRKLSKGTKN